MATNNLDADSGLLLHRTPDTAAIEMLRADVQQWRLLCLSALDQLYATQVVLAREREKVAMMREEQTRFARQVFGGLP